MYFIYFGINRPNNFFYFLKCEDKHLNTEADTFLNIYLDVQEWINSQTKNNKTWQAINLAQFAGDECYRPCSAGQSRVCYWKFVMEHYQAMGV